jgi:asparagine synthase (glutamine-hydrolysing)
VCAVDGEVTFRGSLNPEQSAAVAAINDTMSHRGPDDTGLWSSSTGDATFGHQRLAVIAPEDGHQPMVRETALGEIAISYNGEIYNAKELRGELETYSHPFEGNSDTEVFLRAYEKWGEGAFERLRGDFGVAIWDGPKRKLVLGRDPAGVVPLHYYKTPVGAVFASEAKALLAHPQIRPAVGRANWQEMFGASKTPGRSIWSGVNEVSPGSIVTISEDGVNETRYWKLPTREHTDSHAETTERVLEHLERIVSEQLTADVSVSSLLSGGLDSSGIVAIAAKILAKQGKSIATHALDFIGHEQHLSSANVVQKGYDTPFAQDVATMWGTEHTVVELDPLHLVSAGLRERIVRAQDRPRGYGDYDVSHLLLFEAVKKNGHSVVLSGQNADELFGGYPIFTDEKVLNGHGWSWPLYNPDELGIFSMLDPDFLNALDLDAYNTSNYEEAISEIDPLPGESALDKRRRQINYLEATRHISILLEYTNLLSMASGLEVRVPFCDRELMEYVYNVPWDMKAPDNRVKGLLKDALHNLLPPSVLNRPKSGYPQIPNPAYLKEIQLQGRELAAQHQHDIFNIIGRTALLEITGKPVEHMKSADRYAINMALEMALWMDIYKPSMNMS